VSIEPNLLDAINRASKLTNGVVPVNVIIAVIATESNFNPGAWNPEPKYHYLWDVKRDRPFRKLTPAEIASETPPPDFPCLAGDPDQEWWAQQASWSYMQPMGAVLRERGFKQPYIPQVLLDVKAAIWYPTKHLLAKIQQYGLEGGISAYNRGVPHPQIDQCPYLKKVLAALAEIRTARGAK